MKTFVISSMDISNVGRAPNVEFTFSEDLRSFVASPPGGHIQVYSISPTGLKSRILLTNTLIDTLFADIISTCTTEKNAAIDAAEIACALYWGMWRMQQVNKE